MVFDDKFVCVCVMSRYVVSCYAVLRCVVVCSVPLFYVLL